jgi:hypothetical protein
VEARARYAPRTPRLGGGNAAKGMFAPPQTQRKPRAKQNSRRFDQSCSCPRKQWAGNIAMHN